MFKKTGCSNIFAKMKNIKNWCCKKVDGIFLQAPTSLKSALYRVSVWLNLGPTTGQLIVFMLLVKNERH